MSVLLSSMTKAFKAVRRGKGKAGGTAKGAGKLGVAGKGVQKVSVAPKRITRAAAVAVKA